MIRSRTHSGARASLPLRTLCAAGCLVAAAAHADETPASAAPTSTENLVRLMVDKSVITREQGEAIVAQARMEASKAEIARSAATPPAPAGAEAPKDGVVRVQYVPEAVKQQLREDIKQEVMDQAKRENWAQPEAVPEWVKHFRVSGDVRVRTESRFYPKGNDTSGAFPDFNAINHGDPYDASPANQNFAQQRNVDRDRDRIRLRVRMGAEIDLGEDFTTGVRLATGNNDSPVSANQTFGANGGFSKYAIWLDRGFIKYETPKKADLTAKVIIGRFDNPFFGTPMIWDEDVGFDGFVGKIDWKMTDSIRPFATGGLFPIFSTGMNFATNEPKKFKSDDKWLYAGQIGTTVKAAKDLDFKVAASYYAFEDVQGRVSSPYTPLGADDAGDTDSSRPGFAQNGNTYMPLRNIVPDASNGFGTTNQFQYYGLISPFRIGALTARADYDGFNPVHMALTGEVVKNFGFDGGALESRAVNNLENNSFAGGDMGYDVNLNFGAAALEKRWDWILGVGYRYVESDAVMDGLSNSDLGNGGTNLQGFTLSGSLAISKSVFVQARWFSAESIAGPTFKADSFFFDITARF